MKSTIVFVLGNPMDCEKVYPYYDGYKGAEFLNELNDKLKHTRWRVEMLTKKEYASNEEMILRCSFILYHTTNKKILNSDECDLYWTDMYGTLVEQFDINAHAKFTFPNLLDNIKVDLYPKMFTLTTY